MLLSSFGSGSRSWRNEKLFNADMLNRQDEQLIDAAREAITQRYRNDWQEVGAALRTRDGRIYTGVNLDAYLGRMAVCAEAVALGRAVTESGEMGIDTIVAVRHPEPSETDRAIVVVSPCGSCRELIWDYDRDARVIVPSQNGPVIAAIADLLPNKYSRERTL
jgi:cytidine deaminase